MNKSIKEPLTIITLDKSVGSFWEESMQIYRDAFCEWEREPEAVIADRVNEGLGLLVVGTIDNIVVGFYLLDLHPEFDYALFSYLAIDRMRRGEGVGTRLCCDAMKRFKMLSDLRWLFVEAETRQAAFYGRLGFLKLALDYHVPCYGNSCSVAMNLMVLAAADTQNTFAASELSNIVQNIFVDGYQLEKKDPRIKAQLFRITDETSLITWP